MDERNMGSFHLTGAGQSAGVSEVTTLCPAAECAGCGLMATPGGPCQSPAGQWPYVCVAYEVKYPPGYPRLRRDGESVEAYRVAMGWDQPKPDPFIEHFAREEAVHHAPWPEVGTQCLPVAWRVRGYNQFKTGAPGEWRYIDGAKRPKVNNPDCCDIEPLYLGTPSGATERSAEPTRAGTERHGRNEPDPESGIRISPGSSIPVERGMV